MAKGIHHMDIAQGIIHPSIHMDTHLTNTHPIQYIHSNHTQYMHNQRTQQDHILLQATLTHTLATALDIPLQSQTMVFFKITKLMNKQRRV